MTQPLAGLKVLDFSTLLPGPMATLLLAEAGAAVTKIERADGGDPMRHYPPFWGDVSANFALLNRGKTSVALDLKSADGRGQALAMAAEADVVIEQFRPGVMARLGFGYDAVRALNPRVIYCAITGYGQSGPKRDRAGHDLNYIGDAGLLSLAMGEPGHRVLPPGLIADIAGGAYPAVMNILLAVIQRERTGEGAFLDVAMSENVMAFLFWALGEGQATGTWPGNMDRLLSGGGPRYRLYDASDSKVIAVAAIEDKFWAAFCEAIGLPPALRDDATDPEGTMAAVAAILAKRTAEEWAPIFWQADCCVTVVPALVDAVGDPHVTARGLFAHTVTSESGAAMPALPVPIVPGFRSPPDKRE